MSALADLSGTMEYKEVQEAWEQSSPGVREAVVVFGALLFVTILVLIWAIFIRKSGPRRHSRRRQHSASREQEGKQAAEKPDGVPVAAAAVPPSESRKKRRRRSRSRLNPTLAQTGGLPPIRGQDPSETSS